MTPQLREAVLDAGAEEFVAVRSDLRSAAVIAESAGDASCLLYAALYAVLGREDGGDPDPLLGRYIMQAERWQAGVTFAVIEELNNTQLDRPESVLPGALAREVAIAGIELVGAIRQAEEELEQLSGLPEGWS